MKRGSNNKPKVVLIGSGIILALYAPGVLFSFLLQDWFNGSMTNDTETYWITVFVVITYAGPIGGIATRILGCRAVARSGVQLNYWQRYGLLSMFLPAIYIGKTLHSLNLWMDSWYWAMLLQGMGTVVTAAILNFAFAAINFKPGPKEELLDEDLYRENEI